MTHMQTRFSDILALFIFARRKHEGLTQAEYAELVGVNERQIRAAENKQYLGKRTLWHLAAWCGIEDDLAKAGGKQMGVMQ